MNDTIVAEVTLWHGKKDHQIVQFGQKRLNSSKGPDEDAVKKAVTDGLTKCLSYLGFNADVFLGKFDDNKYVEKMTAEHDENAKAYNEWAKEVLVDLGNINTNDELVAWLDKNKGKVDQGMKTSQVKALALSVQAQYKVVKDELDHSDIPSQTTNEGDL